MLNNYFDNISIGYSVKDRKENSIKKRRNRSHIVGFNKVKKGYFFQAGDILRFVYEKGPVGYFFEGLCLSVKKGKFLSKNTTLLIRNVIMGVGIELNLSYYLTRIYKLRFSDYKRKRFFYNRPRLYYLRDRLNRESRVNT